MLEKCIIFRGIFNEKHKVGEILFQEGAININDLQFPKHSDKGKAK